MRFTSLFCVPLVFLAGCGGRNQPAKPAGERLEINFSLPKSQLTQCPEAERALNLLGHDTPFVFQW
jgi:hypothetical protein